MKRFGPLLKWTGVVGAGIIVSGCMQAPTYGTGKRQDVQFIEDITGILSVAPQRGEEIEYQPRPALVKPATADVLPAPQQPVTEQAALWPESPEERRARIRAEITANQDDPLYRSPVINTGLGQVNRNGELTREEQRQRFREGRAVQQGAYQGRRYLSDPPVEYKLPAETAAVGDVGEPERAKERRRLREARAASGRSGLGALRDLLPW